MIAGFTPHRLFLLDILVPTVGKEQCALLILGITGQDIPLIKIWRWLIQLGFRLLYQELAWTYDSVSWLVSFGHWQEWGRASLPFIRGTDILELAHGPGHLQSALISLGYRTYGIDRSAQMSRTAGQRLKQNRLPSMLARGEAQSLPYRCHSFDTIIAAFPTEFIVDPQTLACIHRVLRPGGRLIVVVEGRLLGQGPLYRIIEWLFVITGQRQVPGQSHNGSDIWMDIQRIMSEAGFSIELKRIRNQESEVVVAVAEKQED